jgi:hypothetical protein
MNEGFDGFRGRGARARAVLRAPLLAGWVLSCSHHVRMQSPDTAPGARYTCNKQSKECTPATTDVPAELNQSGTTFVNLPRQCQGRINQIVVLDADTSNPQVDVTCAPAEEPIQEME